LLAGKRLSRQSKDYVVYEVTVSMVAEAVIETTPADDVFLIWRDELFKASLSS